MLLTPIWSILGKEVDIKPKKKKKKQNIKLTAKCGLGLIV